MYIQFECKIEVCARESEDGANLHFAHNIVTLTNLQYPTKDIVSWLDVMGVVEWRSPHLLMIFITDSQYS